MKKTILSLALAVCMLNAFPQVKKETSKDEKKVVVPETVKKAFTAKFANAANVEWGLEKEDEYEAEFTYNKVEMSVVFDEKGTLLETESKINEKDLPEAIKTAVAKDFAGYKIDEIEKTDAKGSVSYEMKAEKGESEMELVFDGNGKLLKKTEGNEEEDND